MSEGCKDCLNAENLSKRIEEVKKIVDDKGDMFEKRITLLERRGDVTDQKFLQVFEKLDEIIAILRERENRLPNFVWSVGGMVLGGAIMGVISWMLNAGHL